MKVFFSRRLRRCPLRLLFFLLIGLVFLCFWNYQPQAFDRPFDHCLHYARILPMFCCKWPPHSVNDLRNYRTGFIDLAIKPLVLPHNKLLQLRNERMLWLSRLHSVSLKNLSLQEIYALEHRARMFDSDRSYDLYPSALNLVETVKAVRDGKPVSQYPMNDLSLQVLRAPKHTCAAQNRMTLKPQLIVVVKSCLACSKDRQHARETYMQPHLWPNFLVQFVFVTGVPMLFSETSELNVTIQSRQQLNSSRISRQLFHEADAYEDLLIGNFLDTYNNLTIKMMLTFRWISVFCQNQSPLFLFIDTDYSIVPSSVMTMLAQIPESLKPYVNAGVKGPDRRVLHETKNVGSRWKVSKEEIPWTIYPPYPSGATYLVGYELIVDASIAMSFVRFFRIDDVFLGFVWAKLDSHIYYIPQMLHRIHAKHKLKDIVSAPKKMLDPLMDWELGKFRISNKSIG